LKILSQDQNLLEHVSPGIHSVEFYSALKEKIGNLPLCRFNIIKWVPESLKTKFDEVFCQDIQTRFGMNTNKEYKQKLTSLDLVQFFGDVEVVMLQADVDQLTVEDALIKDDRNVVDTIMDLTM
jgi:hypothetical protein